MDEGYPPPRFDFIYDASNHQHQFHISIDQWIYTYSPARSISVIGEHPNSERSPNASLQDKMVLAIKSSKQNVVASTHVKKYARLAFPISLVFRVRMTRTCIHIYIYIFKQKASTAPQKPQLHHRGLLLFGGFNTSGLLSRSPPRLELMLSLAIVGGRQKLSLTVPASTPRSGPITRGIG